MAGRLAQHFFAVLPIVFGSTTGVDGHAAEHRQLLDDNSTNSSDDIEAEQISIEFDGSTGRYRVLSNLTGYLGVNGTVRGAGGLHHTEAAVNAGADALRTWGLDQMDRTIGDAEDAGLKISAGLWLPHWSGRYKECEDLEEDAFWMSARENYVAGVRKYKNSPAILWWTVGNEMELEVNPSAGNDCVWKRVEWIAQAVKEEDPNHPVGTCLAGVAKPKVTSIDELCPSLDFVGVNSYGDDALHVGPQLREWGWTRPFALLEFGPRGHWASPMTEFGSYVEESSTEKVPRYNNTCYSCYEDELCIGAFAFVWGWKWEKTGTWYNLFNEWTAVTENVTVPCPDCESEVMAALHKCWSGEARVDLPPSVHSVQVDGEVLADYSFTVPQSQAVTLQVNASHPAGKDMVAIWAVTKEVVSDAIGGAHEDTNQLLDTIWQEQAHTATGLEVSLNTSQLANGNIYRMYVFVRQDPATCEGNCDAQEAVASLPFYICHTAELGEVCYSQVMYAKTVGIVYHPQTYPGVTANSTFEEFQIMLHQKKEGECPAPCGAREWCYTSQPGEECYGNVMWAMEHGLEHTPEIYPWYLHNNATFETFQKWFYEKQTGICTNPCPPGSSTRTGSEDSESTYTATTTEVELHASSGHRASSAAALLSAFTCLAVSLIFLEAL